MKDIQILVINCFIYGLINNAVKSSADVAMD
jgi:hypothetical protein